MKQFIAILVFAASFTLQSHAQSFLNDLKQSRQGEGKVTVEQSADIDNLVNNAQLKASNNQTAPQQNKPGKQDITEKKPATGNASQHREEHNAAAQHTPAAQHNATESEHRQNITEHKPAVTEHKTTAAEKQHAAKTADSDTTPLPPAVDTSKKMMRNSYKVTGYRIQAYSGGNSRADREKANKIGDAIKMKYPDQPVYVHFYSPRWICRVGNFRSYNEAAQLLKGIKAMGYKQACIVKGKINVAY